jgi:hypothetical protein
MTNVDTSTPVSNDNNTAAPQGATPPAGPGFFRRLGGGIKSVATSRTTRSIASALGGAAYLIGISAATLVVAGAVSNQLPKSLRGRK